MRTLLALVLMTLVGCGSIFVGSTQTIDVQTNPKGAQLALDGKSVGVSPVTLTLKRGNDHMLTVTREGCETVRVALEREFAFARTIVGNILWAIGGVLDVGTGAAYDLTPDDIALQLKC